MCIQSKFTFLLMFLSSFSVIPSFSGRTSNPNTLQYRCYSGSYIFITVAIIRRLSLTCGQHDAGPPAYSGRRYCEPHMGIETRIQLACG